MAPQFDNHVKPEEIVCQYVLKILTENLQYPAKNIAREVRIQMGRDNRRADIVIYKDGCPHNPQFAQIIIECKKLNARQDEEATAQLHSYMAACPNVRFGVVATDRWTVYERITTSRGIEFVRVRNLPNHQGEFVPFQYRPFEHQVVINGATNARVVSVKPSSQAFTSPQKAQPTKRKSQGRSKSKPRSRKQKKRDNIVAAAATLFSLWICSSLSSNNYTTNGVGGATLRMRYSNNQTLATTLTRVAGRRIEETSSADNLLRDIQTQDTEIIDQASSSVAEKTQVPFITMTPVSQETASYTPSAPTASPLPLTPEYYYFPLTVTQLRRQASYTTIPADTTTPSTLPTRTVSPPSPTATPRLNTIRTTSGQSANVRAQPNAAALVVGQLANGAQIVVLETSDDGEWSRILTMQGREGWVAVFLIQDAP